MRFAPVVLAASAFLCASVSAEDADDKPDKETLKLLQRAEELRGHKFEKYPKVRYWGEDELKKMMKEEFDAELPEAKAKDVTDIMVAFGLLPKDYDLRKEFMDLMMEQIAGFYDPKKKILCLIRGKSGKGLEEETVIVHELTHALQDQYYDLNRLDDLVAQNDDEVQALKCLTEGEATMTMLDHSTLNMTGQTCDQTEGIEEQMGSLLRTGGGPMAAEKLAKAPPAIREGLIGQYADGFSFCVKLKRKGGWEALNKAWEDLPVSTEQILHPERYIERDMPQLAKLPGKIDGMDDWKIVDHDNTMGEFSVRMVFETLFPSSPKSGQEAAAGWDGDTYRLYRNGDKTLLMWATVWDTETDAREFVTAYQKAVRQKLAGLDAVKANGNSLSHDSKSGWVAIERDGKKAFVVEGGTEAEAKAVLAAMKEKTTFEEMKPGFGAKEKKDK